MTTPDNTGAGSRKAAPYFTKLRNVIDTLGAAQTRCAALNMASEALDSDHRDVVAFLAGDADDVINRAIEVLQEIIEGEGNGNG